MLRGNIVYNSEALRIVLIMNVDVIIRREITKKRWIDRIERDRDDDSWCQ